MKITIEYKGKKKYDKGVTVLDLLDSKLRKKAVVAKVNDELYDVNLPIGKDSRLEVFTFEDEEGKQVFWHSTNHVLANAVKNLFPETKLAIGPAIEHGYYYDFERKEPFGDDELAKIEKEMEKIVNNNVEVKRSELKREEAIKKNKELKEPYRNILIKEDITDKKIPFYEQGDFIDMCKGPHVPRTGMIRAFKLLKVSGSYWRADAKKQQLQRIYGISFPDKKQLNEYLHNLEEAEKRDHRKIGKQLDLFSFHDVSPGSPFFHPKGAFIFITLQNFLRELYVDWGYQEVITPLIYDSELWKTSGHWEHFREYIFDVKMDNKEAALKPMNCPSHILIYKTQIRSYRDLPFRITDFAPLHRNELKGVLGGLTRVRKFSQDDCHVFCTPEQVKDEITAFIKHVKYVYQEVFGFDFYVELSTRPEKAMGNAKWWKLAEKSLKEALDESKCEYKLNPGEGAFYGPKIDFHIKDALGRSWQCGTEQLDFQMPQRFNVQYEGKDGSKHQTIMLHRTVLGSIERFMGILIEHFAGKFPLWISPIQVRILSVADRFNEYAEEVLDKLKEEGVRVEFDSRTESVGKKVRDAQLDKIPLILTVGEKEQNNKTVALRTLDGKVEFGVKADALIKRICNNVGKKEIGFS